MTRQKRLFINVLMGFALTLLLVAGILVYFNYYPRVTVYFMDEYNILNSVELKKGNPLPNLPRPDKVGSSFEGWYSDDQFNDLYINNQAVTHDLELFAKFEKIEYTLNYRIAGSNVNLYPTHTCYYKDAVSLPTGEEYIEYNGVVIQLATYRDGYDFVGWTLTEDGSGEVFTSTTGFSMVPYNAVLYAKWTPKRFDYLFRTITYSQPDLQGEAVVSDYQVVQFTYTENIVLPQDPEAEHYHFIGWYYDSLFTREVDVDNTIVGTNGNLWLNGVLVNDTGVLYGKFELNEYTISFNVNTPAGSVVLTESDDLLNPISAYYGALVTQIPSNGLIAVMTTNRNQELYRFMGWNTNADGTGWTVLGGDAFLYSQDEDMVLYAKWQRYYYLTFYHDNRLLSHFTTKAIIDGNTVGLPTSLRDADGNEIIIPGQHFSGWKVRSGDRDFEGVTYTYVLNKQNDISFESVIENNIYHIDIVIDSGTATGPLPDLNELTFEFGSVIKEKSADNPNGLPSYTESAQRNKYRMQGWIVFNLNSGLADTKLTNNPSASDEKRELVLNTTNIKYADYIDGMWVITIRPYYKQEVTISYDLNGGTSSREIEPVSVMYDEYVQIESAQGLSREYYNFAGWNVNKDAETAQYRAGTSQKFSADTTLFAIWTPIEYRLKVVNKGATGTGTSSKSYSFNARSPLELEISEAELRLTPGTGRYFEGLTRTLANVNVEGTSDYLAGETHIFHVDDEDVTFVNDSATNKQTFFLYTNMPVSRYTVEWYVGDTLYHQETLLYNTPLVHPTSPVEAGWNFNGWRDSNNNRISNGYPVLNNLRLEADRTRTTFTITFRYLNPNKVVYREAKSFQYEYNVPFTTDDYNQVMGIGEYDAQGVNTFEGYDFMGWFASQSPVSTDTPDFVSGQSFTRSATFYTIYKAKALSITFNPNGGDGEAYTETNHYYGETIVLPTSATSEFTREGKTLVSWNDGTSTIGNAGQSVTINLYGAVTFNAEWANNYTLTYLVEDEDATVTGLPEVATYVDGTSITIPTTIDIIIEGKTFGGSWTDGSSVYAKGSTFVITHDTVLRPVFGDQQVTATYKLEHNGTIRNFTSGTRTYTYGDSVEFYELSSSERQFVRDLDGTNNAILGWTLASDRQTVLTSYVITSDTVFYLRISPQYTLSYNLDPPEGATATNTPTSTLFVLGVETTLSNTEPVCPGYSFVGWALVREPGLDDAVYEKGETVVFESLTTTNGITLYAEWQPADLVLTYVSTESSQTSVGKGVQINGIEILPSAESVIEGGFIYSGYRLTGWKDSSNNKIGDVGDTIRLSITADTTWYAIWEREYTVYFDYLSSSTPFDNAVIVGETITLINNPYTVEGKRFTGWVNEGVTYNENASVTIANAMIADNKITFTANLVDITYTLTFNEKNADIAETISTTRTVLYAGSTNAPAGSDTANYRFLGWSTTENGLKEINSGDAISNVRSDSTYYAVYVRTYTITYTNGTTSVPQKYDVDTVLGEGATAFETPSGFERSGYLFVGYTDGTRYYQLNSTHAYTTAKGYLASLTVTANITLTATYAKLLTLTLADGANTHLVGSNYTYGDTVNLTEFVGSNIFTNEGYSIAGFSTTNGGVKLEGNIYNFTGDENTNVTLYTVWGPLSKLVYFHPNNGSAVITEANTVGQLITNAPTVTYTSHVFDEWYVGTSSTCDYSVVFDLSSDNMTTTDLHLYAKWTKLYYVLFELDLPEGESLVNGAVPTVEDSYLSGESVNLTMTTPIERAGYTFVSWTYYYDNTQTATNITGTKVIGTDLAVNSADGVHNLVFKPVWAAKTFNLTFVGVANATIRKTRPGYSLPINNGSSNAITVYYDTVVTVTNDTIVVASSDGYEYTYYVDSITTNYEFVSWNDALNAEVTTFNMPATSYSIHPLIQPGQTTINYQFVDPQGGLFDASGESTHTESVTAGTSSSAITFTINPGHTFSYWYYIDEYRSENFYTTTIQLNNVTADCEVYVQTALKPITVTVTFSKHSDVAPSVAFTSETFAYGTTPGNISGTYVSGDYFIYNFGTSVYFTATTGDNLMPYSYTINGGSPIAYSDISNSFVLDEDTSYSLVIIFNAIQAKVRYYDLEMQANFVASDNVTIGQTATSVAAGRADIIQDDGVNPYNGRRFVGWYTTSTFDAGTEFTTSTIVTTDPFNVYAKRENLHKLVFSSVDTGTTGTLPNDTYAVLGGVFNFANSGDFDKPGYNLVGWTLSYAGGSSVTVTLTDTRTIQQLVGILANPTKFAATPVWEVETYTIYFTTNNVVGTTKANLNSTGAATSYGDKSKVVTVTYGDSMAIADYTSGSRPGKRIQIYHSGSSSPYTSVFATAYDDSWIIDTVKFYRSLPGETIGEYNYSSGERFYTFVSGDVTVDDYGDRTIFIAFEFKDNHLVQSIDVKADFVPGHAPVTISLAITNPSGLAVEEKSYVVFAGSADNIYTYNATVPSEKIPFEICLPRNSTVSYVTMTVTANEGFYLLYDSDDDGVDEQLSTYTITYSNMLSHGTHTVTAHVYTYSVIVGSNDTEWGSGDAWGNVAYSYVEYPVVDGFIINSTPTTCSDSGYIEFPVLTIRHFTELTINPVNYNTTYRRFDGWYDTKTLDHKYTLVDSRIVITHNANFYANWQKLYYVTIDINAGGDATTGSVPSLSNPYVKGSAIDLTTTLARTGYTFSTWEYYYGAFLESTNVNKVAGIVGTSPITVHQDDQIFDLLFRPHWQVIAYNLTINGVANATITKRIDGSVASTINNGDSDVISVNYHTAITVVDNVLSLTNTSGNTISYTITPIGNYEISGWTNNGTDIIGSITMPASAYSLRPKVTAGTIHITYVLETAGSGKFVYNSTQYNTLALDVETATTSPLVTFNRTTGYSFVKWYYENSAGTKDESNTTSTSTSIQVSGETTNCTVYVRANLMKIDVTFNFAKTSTLAFTTETFAYGLNDASSISGAYASGTTLHNVVTFGDVVYFTATTSPKLQPNTFTINGGAEHNYTSSNSVTINSESAFTIIINYIAKKAVITYYDVNYNGGRTPVGFVQFGSTQNNVDYGTAIGTIQYSASDMSDYVATGTPYYATRFVEWYIDQSYTELLTTSTVIDNDTNVYAKRDNLHKIVFNNGTGAQCADSTHTIANTDVTGSIPVEQSAFSSGVFSYLNQYSLSAVGHTFDRWIVSYGSSSVEVTLGENRTVAQVFGTLSAPTEFSATPKWVDEKYSFVFTTNSTTSSGTKAQIYDKFNVATDAANATLSYGDRLVVTDTTQNDISRRMISVYAPGESSAYVTFEARAVDQGWGYVNSQLYTGTGLNGNNYTTNGIYKGTITTEMLVGDYSGTTAYVFFCFDAIHLHHSITLRSDYTPASNGVDVNFTIVNPSGMGIEEGSYLIVNGNTSVKFTNNYTVAAGFADGTTFDIYVPRNSAVSYVTMAISARTGYYLEYNGNPSDTRASYTLQFANQVSHGTHAISAKLFRYSLALNTDQTGWNGQQWGTIGYSYNLYPTDSSGYIVTGDTTHSTQTGALAYSLTQIPHFTSVTINAAANNGRSFSYWNTPATSTAANFTFAIDSNLSYTAYFVQEGYTYTFKLQDSVWTTISGLHTDDDITALVEAVANPTQLEIESSQYGSLTNKWFDSWQTSGLYNSSNKIICGNTDVVVYANLSNAYTATVSVSAEGLSGEHVTDGGFFQFATPGANVVVRSESHNEEVSTNKYYNVVFKVRSGGDLPSISVCPTYFYDYINTVVTDSTATTYTASVFTITNVTANTNAVITFNMKRYTLNFKTANGSVWQTFNNLTAFDTIIAGRVGNTHPEHTNTDPQYYYEFNNWVEEGRGYVLSTQTIEDLFWQYWNDGQIGEWPGTTIDITPNYNQIQKYNVTIMDGSIEKMNMYFFEGKTVSFGSLNATGTNFIVNENENNTNTSITLDSTKQYVYMTTSSSDGGNATSASGLYFVKYLYYTASGSYPAYRESVSLLNSTYTVGTSDLTLYIKYVNKYTLTINHDATGGGGECMSESGIVADTRVSLTYYATTINHDLLPNQSVQFFEGGLWTVYTAGDKISTNPTAAQVNPNATVVITSDMICHYVRYNISKTMYVYVNSDAYANGTGSAARESLVPAGVGVNNAVMFGDTDKVLPFVINSAGTAWVSGGTFVNSAPWTQYNTGYDPVGYYVYYGSYNGSGAYVYESQGLYTITGTKRLANLNMPSDKDIHLVYACKHKNMDLTITGELPYSSSTSHSMLNVTYKYNTALGQGEPESLSTVTVKIRQLDTYYQISTDNGSTWTNQSAASYTIQVAYLEDVTIQYIAGSNAEVSNPAYTLNNSAYFGTTSYTSSTQILLTHVSSSDGAQITVHYAITSVTFNLGYERNANYQNDQNDTLVTWKHGTTTITSYTVLYGTRLVADLLNGWVKLYEDDTSTPTAILTFTLNDTTHYRKIAWTAIGFSDVTEPEGTGILEASITSNDSTLSLFIMRIYTIHFDPNPPLSYRNPVYIPEPQSNISIADTIQMYGLNVSSRVAPSLEGYTFLGWHSDTINVDVEPSQTHRLGVNYPECFNIIFKAKWMANPATVNFTYKVLTPDGEDMTEFAPNVSLSAGSVNACFDDKITNGTTAFTVKNNSSKIVAQNTSNCSVNSSSFVARLTFANARYQYTSVNVTGATIINDDTEYSITSDTVTIEITITVKMYGILVTNKKGNSIERYSVAVPYGTTITYPQSTVPATYVVKYGTLSSETAVNNVNWNYVNLQTAIIQCSWITDHTHYRLNNFTGSPSTLDATNITKTYRSINYVYRGISETDGGTTYLTTETITSIVARYLVWEETWTAAVNMASKSETPSSSSSTTIVSSAQSTIDGYYVTNKLSYNIYYVPNSVDSITASVIFDTNHPWERYTETNGGTIVSGYRYIESINNKTLGSSSLEFTTIDFTHLDGQYTIRQNTNLTSGITLTLTEDNSVFHVAEYLEFKPGVKVRLYSNDGRKTGEVEVYSEYGSTTTQNPSRTAINSDLLGVAEGENILPNMTVSSGTTYSDWYKNENYDQYYKVVAVNTSKVGQNNTIRNIDTDIATNKLIPFDRCTNGSTLYLYAVWDIRDANLRGWYEFNSNGSITGLKSQYNTSSYTTLVLPTFSSIAEGGKVVSGFNYDVSMGAASDYATTVVLSPYWTSCTSYYGLWQISKVIQNLVVPTGSKLHTLGNTNKGYTSGSGLLFSANWKTLEFISRKVQTLGFSDGSSFRFGTISVSGNTTSFVGFAKGSGFYVDVNCTDYEHANGVGGAQIYEAQAASACDTIGEGAALYNDNLTSVKLTKSTFSVTRKKLFDTTYHIVNKTETAQIVNIEKWAFQAAKPASLVEVSVLGLNKIEEEAFYRQTNLKAIIARKSSSYKFVGDVDTYNSGALILTNVTSSSSSAEYDASVGTVTTFNPNPAYSNWMQFYGCASLGQIGGTSYNPNSLTGVINMSDWTVTEFGQGMFRGCDSIVDVRLPSTLVTLGSSNFYSCDKLEYINMDATSITSIGNSAFSECVRLGIDDECIQLPSTLTSIGESAFNACSALKYIDMSTTSITSIGYRAFKDCNVLYGKDSTTGLVLPSTLTSIGEQAFYNCWSIEKINLYDTSITSIEAYTFAYCTNLRDDIVEIYDRQVDNISLPNTVTSIGTYAFWDCSGFEYFRFSDNITTIGNCAFAYCDRFAGDDWNNYYLPSALTSIGEQAFYCDQNLYYNLEHCTNLTTIGNYAFFGTMSATNHPEVSGDNLIIPSSVTSIGNAAFYSNRIHEGFVYINSSMYIGSEAFAYCTDWSEHYALNVVINAPSVEFGQNCFKQQTGSTVMSLTHIIVSFNVISSGSNCNLFLYDHEGIAGIYLTGNYPNVDDAHSGEEFNFMLHARTTDLANWFGEYNVSTGKSLQRISVGATGRYGDPGETVKSNNNKYGGFGYLNNGDYRYPYFDWLQTGYNVMSETMSGSTNTFKGVSTIKHNGQLYESESVTPRTGGQTYIAKIHVFGNTFPCFADDTLIDVWDEKRKKRLRKKAKDIKYSDKLLVWDFVKGCFAYANPLYIQKIQTATEFTRINFADGSYFDAIKEHSMYNADSRSFRPVTNDKLMPIGTHVFKADGTLTTIASKQKISKKVNYTNIITYDYMNIFTNGILTSTPLNNRYFIPEGTMKWQVNDDHCVDTNLLAGVPARWIKGLHLDTTPDRVLLSIIERTPGARNMLDWLTINKFDIMKDDNE